MAAIQQLLASFGASGNPPTTWTFTYSSLWGPAGTPDQAKLSDGNSATYWGNSSAEANSFLRADFGAAKTLSSVSWRAARGADGWGPTYADGFVIQYSLDGSAWTDIVTITGSSETTTTTYNLPSQVSARYVRAFRADVAYRALSEFYFG